MLVEINRKPSLAIGYLPDGKMEVIELGEASEALKAFEAETAKGEESKYIRVSYFRKLRPEKTRKPIPEKTRNVNVDISGFDGREIPEKIREQIENDPEAYQADVAASAVIVEEAPEPEDKKEFKAEAEPKAKADKKSTRSKPGK